MSALPQKADMCSALGDVRFVPIADIGPASLLDAITPVLANFLSESGAYRPKKNGNAGSGESSA